MNFIAEFTKRTALMEGWGPSTRSWINNNPGNLDAGKRAIGHDNGGYAMYASVSDGWADLEELVEAIIRKHPAVTLQTFYGGERDAEGAVTAGGYPGYAPEKDPRGRNSPSTYAQVIATGLGIRTTDVLLPMLPPLAVDAKS